MSKTLEDVLDELREKRKYQDGKWGTAFDDKNTLNDWNTYIGIEMARGTSMKANPITQREALVNAAALAVAAIGAFDRNGSFPARHYEATVAK